MIRKTGFRFSRKGSRNRHMKTPGGMRLLLVLVLFLFCGVGGGQPAYAAAPPATAIDGFCPDEDGGIVERIVTCLQDHIVEVAYDFVYDIYPLFEGAIHVFLILSVIFFGVRMLLPMLEKPGRDMMIFLLKIASVSYFTANMDLVLYWFVGAPGDAVPGALGEMIEIVTQFSIFDFPLKCAPGFDPFAVWRRIDCLLDVIIGVNPATSLSQGMLAFFFHNFFVGSVGVVIFLLGLWMIGSFVIMLLGAIHTYLIAVMMICLLVIVGVLFSPLIMFKNTFDVFQKWLRMIIANMIIPVVLFAYVNVMLSAFDIVLYSGEHSVFRTFAGEAVDAADFNIQAYMYENGLVIEEEDKGPILDQRAADRFATPAGTVIGGEINQYGEYVGEAGLLPSGDISEIPLAIPMEKIDYDAAAGMVGVASGPALLEQVLAAMIVTALVSYILVALMKNVPELAQELAGGIKDAPPIAQAGMELPMVGNSGGASGIAQGFRQRMGGMVGRR